MVRIRLAFFFFFFFNDTATTEIYTLSLHDALPIYGRTAPRCVVCSCAAPAHYRGGLYANAQLVMRVRDRKSTRLNSSHSQISYAVFCLKKKKQDIKCVENEPDTAAAAVSIIQCPTY